LLTDQMEIKFLKVYEGRKDLRYALQSQQRGPDKGRVAQNSNGDLVPESLRGRERPEIHPAVTAKGTRQGGELLIIQMEIWFL